jgi:hypothetical protein
VLDEGTPQVAPRAPSIVAHRCRRPDRAEP